MFNTLFLLFLLAGQSAPSLLQKALVELQHGDLPHAREDLRQAAQADSTNAFVWSALAEVYARTHETELAAAAAEQAEKNGGSNPVVAHALALYYSRVGQFEKAGSAEERYAASPKADPAAKNRAAAWFLAAGDEPKALALAKGAATGDRQASFELVDLFLRSQQFGDAAEVLDIALHAHPADPQLLLALGVARYGQRRFDDAIVTFLRVVRIDPQIEQPYLFIGRMLDQAGPHLDEITSVTDSWAAKNPANARAQLVLAKVLLVRDPADEHAEALLRRAIELDDSNWESHYELGVLLESSHQYPAAAEQLRRSIELDNKQPNPHYHLARVYDRLGNAPAAAAERQLHQQLTGAGKLP